MSMVFCRGCGEEIDESAKACPHCGATQHGSGDEKSKITAALLAFFLGWFSARKFYLRRTFQGMIYLTFFWTILPWAVSFIEFIVYLYMSEESFESKYG